MFIEVVELIGCFMAGGGASLVGAKLIKKNKPKCPYGTDKFLWGQSAVSGNWGHGCPKCLQYKLNSDRLLPLCDCSEYFRHHFHYKCKDCGYSNIMRTADDS